jgi:hypothetical protein
MLYIVSHQIYNELEERGEGREEKRDVLVCSRLLAGCNTGSNKICERIRNNAFN